VLIRFFKGEEMKSKFVHGLGCTFAILICVLAAANTARAQSGHPHGQFIDAFQKHWETAKGLALAVADAMPADAYDFKPAAPEMTFGEQMLHIAQANFGYCAFIADAKSPYPEPAKDAKIEKAGAIKDLAASFDYCTKVFDGLDETKLPQMHGSGKGTFATMDVMLGVMTHMAHHRGQAEVYLRAKGITPPEYKW
jgi:uncharacterized damage-inducible protein DinB